MAKPKPAPKWQAAAKEQDERPQIRDLLLAEQPSEESIMHKELSEPTDIRHGTHVSSPEIIVVAALKALFPDSPTSKKFLNEFEHLRVSLKRTGRSELLTFADSAFVPYQLRLMRKQMQMAGGMGQDAARWFEV